MKHLITILFIIFSFILLADGVQPTGAGTEADPYQVATLDNLLWISTDSTSWSSYFIQTADIDASTTSTWNSGEGFSPIGNLTLSFTGNYDGQGNIIDGIYFNRPLSDRQGLFGNTESANISNLGVTNCDITGDDRNGALAGEADSSTISFCYSSGSISGDNRNGGLIGNSNLSTIINNCYSFADVTGDNNAGGLVGYHRISSEINNCYSYGSVSGNTGIGGLVGANDNSTVTDSFWDTETSGRSTSAGGTGKTTAEMKTQSTFTNAGWDFVVETTNGTDDTWGMFIELNNGYPILTDFYSVLPPIVTTSSATSISYTSATSGGEVIYEGKDVVTAHGVCWSTSANPTTADFYTSDGNGTGNFTSSITDLSASTEYYYRAYATNTLGTAYGEEYSFTTLYYTTPTVSTTEAASITLNSATSGGNVSSDGGTTVTARGVCWSTSVNPTTDDFSTSDGTGTGSYTSNITGLASITTYYYRAYATNSIDTSYGNEYYFTTTVQGSGTSGDPFQISNLEELRWFSENPEHWGSYFIQTADIDASPTSGWNSGEGFSPIGNTNFYFTGNYDGQDFDIDGLFIFRYAQSQGLFGFIIGAEISNLGVTNVDIFGIWGTGSLVGFNNSSTILSCFSNGIVDGGENVGGLIGTNRNSYIINCFSTATVDGGDIVGGLVGENLQNSSINNSYYTGDVTCGGEEIGGLVGINDNSNISNSYSSGNVTSSFMQAMYIGGLVGKNYNSSSISNSFSTTTVTGDNRTGGLVGGNESSSISFCYSIGFVDGGHTSGGLVGYCTDSTIENSFWDTETSGHSTSAGGTGKTTVEMKTQSTFTDAGWDFAGETTNGSDDIWLMLSIYNSGYPSLTWTVEPILPFVTTITATTITQNMATSGGIVTYDGGADVTARGVCWSTSANPSTADYFTTNGTGTGSFTSNLTGLTSITTYYYRAYATNSLGTSYDEEYSFITTSLGSGTSADPYQINNLDELRWISENPARWNSYFIQTADIDASATSTWNSGEGFSPIGNEPEYFTGNYDGQGFEIDGLYINRPSTSNIGLFGYTTNASIDNVGIIDVDIIGFYATGGLVGYNYTSTINGCFSSGNVYGHNHVGGLVGSSSNSTIHNSYSTCSMSGNDSVGGLVGGSFSNSTISNSSSTGVVSGHETLGGLVGSNGSSNISNCYSTGNVSGDGSEGGAGGLVGNNSSSNISNCYSTGSVSGDDEDLWGGGLVGYGYYSTISNSYSIGSVREIESSGGLVGYAESSSTINSFWDIQTSGESYSAGGTGKTTAEMKTLSTYTDAGWDFLLETANGTDDIWVMSSSLNNNYPVLSWQNGGLFAYFTAAPAEVYSGTPVQFTDYAYGSPTTWQWDFDNDGTYDSTVQNPIHTYSTTDLYSVKLTVSDGTNTDYYIRTDYIYVNTTPAVPQNVQVNLVGDDAVISWDEVTHDIDGIPINLDGYIVKFSEDNVSFFFLYLVDTITHTHQNVVLFSHQMFYQVLSYKAYSADQLDYLKDLNNSDRKVK
jgi:PKD domain/The GLUG motif